MNRTLDFHSFHVPTPTFDSVSAESARLESAFERATTADERSAAIQDWDQLRRRLETWESLTNLRFQQDTSNTEYKQAREYLDELRPKLTELEVRMKRKLVGSPHRAELQRQFGPQAFALWEADILTYDPVIEADMVREAKLQADYTELLAAAKLQFQGETLNHSGITKFREHADRDVRHGAEQVRWG